MATTAEQLTKQFNVTGDNLANIDKIAAMGNSTPAVTKPLDTGQPKGRVMATETPKMTPTEPRVINREAITQEAIETLKSPNIGTKTVNAAFINTLANIKLGRDATADELATGGEFGLGGVTVNQALERFGATDLAPNSGIGFNEVTTPEGGVTETPVVDTKPKTLDEKIADYTSRVDDIKEAKAEEVGLDEKTQIQRDLKEELDTMANDIEFNKILGIEADNLREDLFEEGQEGISTRAKKGAVTQSIVNRELSKRITSFNKETSQMNREDLLREATTIYAYNQKVTQYNLAKGDADEATASVKESADNFKEYRAMAIEDMARETNMAEIEKNDLIQKNNDMWEKESVGYVPINKDNYEAMVREYGENRIYTDAYGDSYLKPAETVDDTFQFVGGSTNQAGGIFNKNTGTFTVFDSTSPTGEVGNVSTATGDVYDIGSYATDPNHEASIQGMLSKMGQFKTVEDIDNYIQTVAPTSEITGQMIANSSEKYGVAWEMMVAIMQQDSSLGTKGLGSRNNNPGNVGQFDSLGTDGVAGYKTLQEGVDAVAGNLAWRKVGKQELDSEISGYVTKVADGGLTTNQALNEVDPKKKAALIDALANVKKPEDTEADDLARNKMKAAISLKDHEGLNTSVGPNKLTRIGVIDQFGEKQDFIAKVEQLISDLSLESLIAAKSRGATFGALSDTEMQILASAATTMASWRQENLIGKKLDGYNVSEDRFKEELDNISKIFERAIKSTITEPETTQENVIEQPDGTKWIENADGTYTLTN